MPVLQRENPHHGYQVPLLRGMASTAGLSTNQPTNRPRVDERTDLIAGRKSPVSPRTSRSIRTRKGTCRRNTRGDSEVERGRLCAGRKSGAALPRAIEFGPASALYLLLITLTYCTTPGSIFILLILSVWFFKSYSSYRTSKSLRGKPPGKGPTDYAYGVGVLAAIVVLGAIAFSKSSAAWQQRALKEKQELQAQGINPDAFKNWELLKKKQTVGDRTTGLTPEIKKRMRESLALHTRGSLLRWPE